MLNGEEIIEEIGIAKHELRSLVWKKQITAYEMTGAMDFAPIRWDERRSMILEIKELVDTPGLTYQDVVVFQTPGLSQPAPPPVINRSRIEIFADEDAVTVPWAELLKNLKKKWVQTAIPQSQHEAILHGWPRVMESMVLEAFYNEDEVLEATGKKIVPPYLDPNHKYYIPELAGLVSAWMALYHDRTLKLDDPDNVFDPVKDWIKENFPDIKPASGNLEGRKDSQRTKSPSDAYLIRILNGGMTDQKGMQDGLLKKIAQKAGN